MAFKNMKKDFEVGDSAEVSKTLTETDVYNFAGICGDFNPVHVNKVAAEKSRFGRQVCHGMLVSSFISTVLGMYLPGPGTIYLEQNTKFTKPVYIGDTIIVRAKITKIEGTIITLDTDVFNQDGERVVSGIAKVMYTDLMGTD